MVMGSDPSFLIHGVGIGIGIGIVSHLSIAEIVFRSFSIGRMI